MTQPASETRSITVALVAYLVLVALQIVAYMQTQFLVLLAQALEMLSDVLISAFLLVSTLWSRRPPDELHMFGHGKGQNVAALVSATILVFFMSLEAFRKAIPRLFRPPEPGELGDPGLAVAVIVIGMVVIAIPAANILRTKAKGASVRAQLVSLLKDEVSYVAALAAVILAGQGYRLADPAASVFVAAVIAYGGVYLFRDNVHFLVGRAPNREFIEAVEKTARSVQGVLGIHDLRAEYVGPNAIHAGFHIEVARGTPVEEAAEIAHRVEQEVRGLTGCQHCVVHVDPAGGIQHPIPRR